MTYLNACADSLALFQLTSSRGGWHNFFRYHIHQVVFQLTSSRGGWLRFGLVLQSLAHFNSHPHEEDDSTSEAIAEYREHFNSHPHEEDDEKNPASVNALEIFQLTSSRGGWRIRLRSGLFPVIFQLTSSRGGWLSLVLQFGSFSSFQLTSSRGGWHTGGVTACATFRISTHILTRRMTYSMSSFWCFVPFQLTSSRGGWPIPVLHNKIIFIFQLTSSRGGWLNHNFLLKNLQYFNSHPHEEDDSATRWTYKLY